MKPTTHTLVLLALCLLLIACGGGGTSMLLPPNGDGLSPATETEFILVKVWPGEDVEQVARDLGGKVIGPVEGTDYWRVNVPEGQEPEAWSDHMGMDHRVMDSEMDLMMSAPEGDGSTLPAGGLLLASAIPFQPELLRIGAELARLSTTGRGVRVAVLDTGVVPHEFLDGRIAPDGWDFVGGDPDPNDEPNGRDDDGDGLVDEGYGHGTFVSSLILAVAPDALIVPYRVLDSDAVGRSSDLAESVFMAASSGVDIINLSASMTGQSHVLEDAIQAARDMGVLVITSAGNTGAEDVNFPATTSSTFAVTAVGPDDAKAGFASYGSEVDLSAPGVDLLGAFPSATGTARWSGTSFSAAITSGGFALLRQAFPTLRADEILNRLEDTAMPIDAVNPAFASRLGKGRIDLQAAAGP